MVFLTWQNEAGVEPHPEVEEDGGHVDDAAKQARRLVVALVLHNLKWNISLYL